jgi:phage terminase Nu1 subunit (DNA packaging protein)
MATQQELASHVDISVRQVRNLIKSGVIPSAKPGGYNIDDCRLAYIRYLRGVKTGQVKSEQDEIDDDNYNALLEREKYREKKRQNDLEEKLIAPVDLLTEALEKSANIIVPILETLPLEIKRHFPEVTGDQITLVKKAVAECRNAIADSELNI